MKILSSLLVLAFVSICSSANAAEPNVSDNSWGVTFRPDWGFDQEEYFFGMQYSSASDGNGGRVYNYDLCPRLSIMALKEGTMRGVGFEYTFTDHTSIKIGFFQDTFMATSFLGTRIPGSYGGLELMERF